MKKQAQPEPARRPSEPGSGANFLAETELFPFRSWNSFFDWQSHAGAGYPLNLMSFITTDF
jgi:hypothetical protein